MGGADYCGVSIIGRSIDDCVRIEAATRLLSMERCFRSLEICGCLL